MMIGTNEHIDPWCRAWQTYREGLAMIRQVREYCAQRQSVRPAILQSLTAFVKARSTLPEFNAILQQQMHYDWKLFGLRGASSGMFLNKLWNPCPHSDGNPHVLRRNNSPHR